MQRRQGRQIGKVGFDGGKSLKESLREMNGVVVVFANVQPDEVQFRMGSTPLGEEHRLSCSGRGHDQGEGAVERIVQLVREGCPIDRIGRCSWQYGHDGFAFLDFPKCATAPPCKAR